MDQESMSSASLVESQQGPGPFSKVVGLYQALLRRTLEHFFPDAILELADGHNSEDWQGDPIAEGYRLIDDSDGLGVEIDWYRTHYNFQPGSPVPFFPAERRLIEIVVRALDLRFRGMFDLEVAHRLERFHYILEDLVVSEFISDSDPLRVTAALEALRVAAFSTYENRRVSMGALLLGSPGDPSRPGWTNPEGAPRFNTRLTALKGFHRLCDGIRTVFLVDRQGDLARTVDIHRWADEVQGSAPLAVPCPRPYVAHAKATRSGGHACLVLTPAQEIKLFAEGTLAFSFSDARWRLLDIPSKYAAWCRAITSTCSGAIAARLFQAALNLSEDRKGALLVVLRDAAKSIPELIAPADRVIDEIATDDPQDPDNISPRLAKRTLHHVVRGQTIFDLDPTVLESLAGIDGAVVTDSDGRLLTFGAILKIAPEALKVARAVEGARTLAALAASFHGPVIKVSEDGLLTMYLGGRRVWEL
jgi:hypothetical protein